MSVPPAAQGLIGRRLADKYDVVDIIGKGGCGVVYRGIQQPVGREVAIKIITVGPEATDSMRQRFFREAKAVAQLQHPAVVTLYDYGVDDDGLVYMVMEFMRGRELRDVIRREAPLAPRRVVALATTVLAALDQAHRQGIVHRDLKPENIMIVEGNFGEETCRLLDFGIAKVLTGEAAQGTFSTREGAVVGTPAYLAPEQAMGHEVGPWTDLYSMGVLLYEMLCGRTPFRGDTAFRLMTAHCSDPIPSLPPGLRIPEPLEAAVRSAMAKDKAERFADAKSMASALIAAVADGKFPDLEARTESFDTIGASGSMQTMDATLAEGQTSGEHAFLTTMASGLHTRTSDVVGEVVPATQLSKGRRRSMMGGALLAVLVTALVWNLSEGELPTTGSVPAQPPAARATRAAEAPTVLPAQGETETAPAPVIPEAAEEPQEVQAARSPEAEPAMPSPSPAKVSTSKPATRRTKRPKRSGAKTEAAVEKTPEAQPKGAEAVAASVARPKQPAKSTPAAKAGADCEDELNAIFKASAGKEFMQLCGRINTLARRVRLGKCPGQMSRGHWLAIRRRVDMLARHCEKP